MRSPTVTIGFSTVYFCAVAALNVSATAGAVMDANGLTFPVPTGEGVAFSVAVTAGDQSTTAQPWTLSYAAATVARVAAASAVGVPTTGGVRVVVLGRGFGSHVPGSPTAWGWSTSAVAGAVSADWVRSPADPLPPLVELQLGGPTTSSAGGAAGNGSSAGGWVQCINVLRLNDSALSCITPEGDGARIAVRITVANAPAATLAGVFSYDPPAVLAVECAGQGCGSSTNASSPWALWTPSSNVSLQGLILAQGAPAGGYSAWREGEGRGRCAPPTHVRQLHLLQP